MPEEILSPHAGFLKNDIQRPSRKRSRLPLPLHDPDFGMDNGVVSRRSPVGIRPRAVKPVDLVRIRIHHMGKASPLEKRADLPFLNPENALFCA